MREVGERFPDLEGAEAIEATNLLGRSERKKNLERLRRLNLAETARILDEAQMKRLWEVALQIAGPIAASWPEFRRALNVSPSQVLALDAVRQSYDALHEDLRQEREKMLRDLPVTGRPLGPERAADMKRRFEANRQRSQQLQEKVAKEVARILTKNQEKRFNDLLGEPFHALEEMRRPGGGDWKKGYVPSTDDDENAGRSGDARHRLVELTGGEVWGDRPSVGRPLPFTLRRRCRSRPSASRARPARHRRAGPRGR